MNPTDLLGDEKNFKENHTNIRKARHNKHIFNYLMEFYQKHP